MKVTKIKSCVEIDCKPIQTGNAYDSVCIQYSPDGLLHQVLYAEKAVENDDNLIALRGKNSVVFIAEKCRGSPLYEDVAFQRIFPVDKNIACAYVGYRPDGRHMIERTLKECKNHWAEFNTEIPLKTLVEVVACYMHIHTVMGHKRPMGCSLLLASHNEDDGPSLYKIDSSGDYYGYYACALGTNMEQARKQLMKFKLTSKSTKQLVQIAAKVINTLRSGREAKNYILNVGVIGKETNNEFVVNCKKWLNIAKGLKVSSRRTESDDDEEDSSSDTECSTDMDTVEDKEEHEDDDDNNDEDDGEDDKHNDNEDDNEDSKKEDDFDEDGKNDEKSKNDKEEKDNNNVCREENNEHRKEKTVAEGSVNEQSTN